MRIKIVLIANKLTTLHTSISIYGAYKFIDFTLYT